MHTRAVHLIATVAVAIVAGVVGGDPLAGWAGPVALAEPATAIMAAGTAFSLFEQRRQSKKAERRSDRAQERAEDIQQAEQAATARERQAEFTGNEEQQRALRAARRVGRRGGSRRQLLSGGGSGNRVVGTTGNLAST